MYRLKNLNNGLFQIHSTKYRNAYEGTPAMVFKKAVEMGVKEMSLRLAVNYMHAMRHDYAEFTSDGILTKTDRNSGDSGPHGFGWQ